ncbi:uncharacterized protein A4U43_C05F7570 [Asparagus officinalis]|uniref:Uncharacterized protein n=1 Tax=Asparagus officinalis TaxID=4686 RepID=A0A5P1EQ14_ASPOF|nr:uncharacterized protein A4U43_C05F7570 [Asparagus officinalis]
MISNISGNKFPVHKGVAMIFESYNSSDVIFFMAIMWLSIISMVMFGSGKDPAQPNKEPRGHGPVFVGGRGCDCGACAAGCGACGTYLS